MSDDFEGKKVFFLYPHSVIQAELISVILENEYEVYMLNDAERAIRLLTHFPGSIIFINIDEEKNEEAWEAYITSLKSDPATAGTIIGILTYNENQALTQKYLMDIGITGGFIRLKLGIEQSTDILLKMLAANEARGRRKYLRVRIDGKSPAVFNLKYNSLVLAGKVIDISSIGMAVMFSETDVVIPKNTLLQDIQLKLKGKLALVSGVIYGTRTAEKGGVIYVVLFTRNKSDATEAKIHNFIYVALQDSLREI